MHVVRVHVCNGIFLPNGTSKLSSLILNRLYLQTSCSMSILLLTTSGL